MKQFGILAIVALASLTFAFSSLKPTMDFEKTEHDFGDAVKQHQPVSCTFTFTNNGNEPLIISNVKPSCGCTTPKWTKEPILPGKSGKITAEYNAAAEGVFNKAIVVTSNASEKSVNLKIKGTVIKSNIVEGEEKGTPLELNKK